jgi:hypothetical protein
MLSSSVPLRFVITLFLGLFPAAALAQTDVRYEERSPFKSVRWADGAPEVLVGTQWHRPISIDGVLVSGEGGILEFCRQTWGDALLTKRFEEDLVQILTRMGHPPKDSVRLALVDPSGNGVSVDAAMTRANRRRSRQSFNPAAVAAPARLISRAHGEAAIEQLAAILASSHSYSAVPRPDGAQPAAAAQAARQRLKDQNTSDDVEAALFCLIAPTGDGHAGVRLQGVPDPGPFLPFLPIALGVDDGSRIAAVSPDRSGFVNSDYPFIVAIGGQPISRWLDVAAARAADGSPQLIRERSCRVLRSYGQLCTFMGRPVCKAGEPLTLMLANQRGEEHEVHVRLAARKPEIGDWPRTNSRIIEAQGRRIAYLRVASMEHGEAFERDITGWLDKAQASDGLIIDVRGNGGGRRDIINIVGPRLLPQGAEPVVYNASRPIRLAEEQPGEMDQRLASRFLFRADDSPWSPAQAAAIARFRGTFKPEVVLPDDRFGPWYFAVISPAAADVPRITCPVVVLMNSACFSATDVFLGAMRLLPGVTLLGEPSGGGSGLVRPHQFTVAVPTGEGGDPLRCEAALSSMVSFAADGQLFDRRGIQPHAVLAPVATDYVIGGTDTALHGAQERLLALRQR